MTRIFISHSYLDEAIAYKLVNFLLAALRLEEEEIFCSSNPDQGLNFRFIGVTDQLKKELKNSEALIVLITADSLHSAWIPFEAGAFWPTDKPIIPILGPGLTLDDLQGPLKSLLSISIDAKDWKYKVNNAINQLVNRLKIEQKVSKRRDDTLREFSEALRAWQSQRTAPDVSQQERIEELTQKIEDQERNYQYQKQKLEQNIHQIRELEQQLEQARSQVEQLQLSERAHNQQLEEQERSHNQQLEESETILFV
ncbi:MAG: TIR domain-containing protein [Xenococcus sp. MO_188.B8]|nr:TIR domain-containing protein [Xenococcus sp. MO_188.B8]